ncbi:MAG TPA: YheC/YheD family protein [Firmicutes bacterium]|nr:YheC/YheD family protein [Bacillota bacterium]
MNKTAVGILTPYSAPFRAYEAAALELNVSLVVMTPADIAWKAKQVRGLVFSGEAWRRRTVPLPGGIYNRYYGPKPAVVDRLENILGENKVFNHITRFNKWEVHNILQSTELSPLLPATQPYSPAVFTSFLEKFGRVILKPTLGHLGLQIYLAEKDDNTYHLYCGSRYPKFSFASAAELEHKAASLLAGSFLIQQFIPFAAVERRIFDTRFLVQKDGTGTWRTAGALSRKAVSYSYITNVSKRVTAAAAVLEKAFPNRPLLKKLQAISLAAAQSLEAALGSLGEISVDLALDQEARPWLIEINGKPTKSIFKEIEDEEAYKNAYLLPLAYASYLAAV